MILKVKKVWQLKKNNERLKQRCHKRKNKTTKKTFIAMQNHMQLFSVNFVMHLYTVGLPSPGMLRSTKRCHMLVSNSGIVVDML